MPTGRSVLGPYRLESLLGEGGMGQVYRAWHEPLGRAVALKLLSASLTASDEAAKRFQREARLAAQLNHPHLIKILDGGIIDGLPYIAMELVENGAVSSVIGPGQPMPWRQALQIIAAVVDALAYLHEQRILHRDIKPANILLAADGSPKLADFGLARAMDSTVFTAAGLRVGTFLYMAPEQIAGEPASPATDVWSVSCVLYECLTGHPHVSSATPAAILALLQDSVVAPDVIVPEIPRPVSEFACRCLDAASTARPDTAAMLLDELNQLLGKTADLADDRVPQPRSPPGERTVILPRPVDLPSQTTLIAAPRRWWPVASLLCLIIVLMVGYVRPRERDQETMVSIPAGEFRMGSDSGWGDEAPTHVVHVDAFSIDQHVVTNRRFQAFVSATGYVTSAERSGVGVLIDEMFGNKEVRGADWRHPLGPADSIKGRMDRPVVQVSWDDAVRFCEWAGKRLPTEAEWERAIRGGLEGAEFPWGNEVRSGAVLFGPPVPEPPPDLGSISNNFSVCYPLDDLWELCNDWYLEDYYKVSPRDNPVGPPPTGQRAGRGGCHPHDARLLRCAQRGGGKQHRSWSNTGFRCVRGRPVVTPAGPVPTPSVTPEPVSLFSRWRRVEPLLPEGSGGALPKATYDALRRATALDFGQNASAWSYWVRMGRWLEFPGGSSDPPRSKKHQTGPIPGIDALVVGKEIGDAVEQLRARVEARHLTLLVQITSIWPEDGRCWLALASLLDREGDREHAISLYRVGLQRLGAVGLAGWAAKFWEPIAKALLVIPGLDVEREWLRLFTSRDPTETAFTALVSVAVAEKYDGLERPLRTCVAVTSMRPLALAALKNYFDSTGAKASAVALAEETWGRGGVAPVVPEGRRKEFRQYYLQLGQIETAKHYSKTGDAVETAQLEACRDGGTEGPMGTGAAAAMELMGEGRADPEAERLVKNALFTEEVPREVWARATGALSLPAGRARMEPLLALGRRHWPKGFPERTLRALWLSRCGRVAESIQELQSPARYQEWVPDELVCEMLSRAIWCDRPAGTGALALQARRSLFYPANDRGYWKCLQRGDFAKAAELVRSLRNDRPEVPVWCLVRMWTAANAGDGRELEELRARARCSARYMQLGRWFLEELARIEARPPASNR